ncbi:unnamed protein product, partial [Linum tenue]
MQANFLIPLGEKAHVPSSPSPQQAQPSLPSAARTSPRRTKRLHPSPRRRRHIQGLRLAAGRPNLRRRRLRPRHHPFLSRLPPSRRRPRPLPQRHFAVRHRRPNRRGALQAHDHADSRLHSPRVSRSRPQ